MTEENRKCVSPHNRNEICKIPIIVEKCEVGYDRAVTAEGLLAHRV
jgi:hypothetical protein